MIDGAVLRLNYDNSGIEEEAVRKKVKSRG
jgi:hypothetical protein